MFFASDILSKIYRVCVEVPSMPVGKALIVRVFDGPLPSLRTNSTDDQGETSSADEEDAETMRVIRRMGVSACLRAAELRRKAAAPSPTPSAAEAAVVADQDGSARLLSLPMGSEGMQRLTDSEPLARWVRWRDSREWEPQRKRIFLVAESRSEIRP